MSKEVGTLVLGCLVAEKVKAPRVSRLLFTHFDLRHIAFLISPIILPNKRDGNVIKVGANAEKDGQTLLVPTNAAFDKLPEDVNGRLLEDQPFAQNVVQRHILDEVLFSTFSLAMPSAFQVLCCSGIAKNNIFFNRSRRRSGSGQVSVSGKIQNLKKVAKFKI